MQLLDLRYILMFYCNSWALVIILVFMSWLYLALLLTCILFYQLVTWCSVLAHSKPTDPFPYFSPVQPLIGLSLLQIACGTHTCKSWLFLSVTSV